MSVSIMSILGHVPTRENYLYVCSMTYEDWSETDLDHGYTDNRGYVYADERLSHADVMSELSDFTADQTSCWPVPDDSNRINFWLTRTYQDPYTGIHEVRSFHLHHVLTPSLEQWDSYRYGLQYNFAWATNADMATLMRDAGLLPRIKAKRIKLPARLKNRV